MVEQGESAVEEIAEIMSCELTQTDRRKVMEKLDYMCQPEDLERYRAEFAREDRQLPLSIHL